MTIAVEGIGGTGKAVVNLLHTQRAIATALDIKPPAMQFFVIDHDTAGLPDDLKATKPFQGEGRFRDLMTLTTAPQRSAAGALYSSRELDLNVSSGVYGHPKVAASLMKSEPAAARRPFETIVLVFSDIGGIGAGVGPLKLQALLGDTATTAIVALVFGKYLSGGTARPIGFEWLKQRAKLVNPEGRLLDCYYVNVPPLNVHGESPSHSGLNPTPALVLASNFIWRLAERADAGKRNEFLKDNDRSEGNEIYKEVTYTSDPARFGLDGDDFVGRVRRSAVSSVLNPLIERGEEYRNAGLREILGRQLETEAWRVLGSEAPGGLKSTTDVDHAAGFADTYAAVPEVWAAADWFHNGVLSEPTGTLASYFRKLVYLYLTGELHVLPTGWDPFGEGPIYALTTETIRQDAPDYESRFREAAVGFFTRRRPFWITSACTQRLSARTVTWKSDGVNLRVNDDSPLGQSMRARRQQETAIAATEALPFGVSISTVARQRVSEWTWSLSFEAKDWRAAEALVRHWNILAKQIDILSGSVTIGGVYSCAVSGVALLSGQLAEFNRIDADGAKGVEYWELAVNTGMEQQTRRVLKLAGTSAPTLLNKPEKLGVVSSNVEIVITPGEVMR